MSDRFINPAMDQTGYAAERRYRRWRTVRAMPGRYRGRPVPASARLGLAAKSQACPGSVRRDRLGRAHSDRSAGSRPDPVLAAPCHLSNTLDPEVGPNSTGTSVGERSRPRLRAWWAELGTGASGRRPGTTGASGIVASRRRAGPPSMPAVGVSVAAGIARICRCRCIRRLH
jgi:hypothetical protein